VTLQVTTIGPAPIHPSAGQVMVRMRDGVTLATDGHLASGTAPRPAVLVRLP
jgi:predicted acyl esterase